MKNILAIAFAVLSLGYLQAQEAPRNQSDKTENHVNHEHKKHHRAGRQKFHAGGMQKAHNPELRAAMEKYRAESLMPAMQDEHKAMLKNLSKADRKFLDKKREELATLRKKQEALRTAIHTAKKAGNNKEEIHSKFKTQREALETERKAFFDSMKEFIQRNETNLQNTRENIKTIREKAAVEHKNLRQQYKPANSPDRPEIKEGEQLEFKKSNRPERKEGERPEFKKGNRPEIEEGKEHRPHHGKGHHKHHKNNSNKEDKFIKFLLWDGEVANQKNLAKNDVAPQAVVKTSVYPNPAQNITTLKIDLPKDVKSLQIRIVDLQGKTIHTQTEKSVAAGEQVIQLNVEKFPSGTYFYNIIADDLKVSSSLIIAK